MSKIRKHYQLILELDKLKQVFRNTNTDNNRKESTAEHSWSVSMIIMLLMDELRQEFGAIDELKAIKLALIHDIVEIYAGDVIAFDIQARKGKEKLELEALEKLMSIEPEFGKQLYNLWHEFEACQTMEARIAKAADSICPIFQRLHAKQSYQPYNVSITKLEQVKKPLFAFSKTFTQLYQQLLHDLKQEALIAS